MITRIGLRQVNRVALGGLEVSTEEQNIQDSLNMIISTQKGTRAGMPDYGNNIVDLVFDPNDDALRLICTDDLKRAIELYEPRVEVELIHFFSLGNNMGVKVDYRVKEISDKYMEDEIIWLEQG